MQHKKPTLAILLAGIGIGALTGALFPEAGVKISFLGDIFLRLLTMLVAPLVLAAMVTGISRLGDIRKLGPLGSRTISFYLGTTSIAVATGIALVLILHPGSPHPSSPAFNRATEASAESAPNTSASATAMSERSPGELLEEVITGMVPTNIFKAMAENDILPVITFGLLLGGVLTTMGDKGKPVLEFFTSMDEALMKIIQLIMYAAPVGIGALVAGRLGEAGGWSGFAPELMRLGGYTITVIGGLLLHSLVTLPLLLRLVAKTSPARYASNASPALLTAFSTASSSATLPMTIECATEKNGVSQKTAGFVLPLGATINMDGTALYEAVAVLYIAQMNGIELAGMELIVVFVTATLAAIGAAGIPEAGLVTMLIVLKAVGLPAEGIAMILAVDWFLDRCRTTVNVWGDSVGASVIDRITPQR